MLNDREVRSEQSSLSRDELQARAPKVERVSLHPEGTGGLFAVVDLTISDRLLPTGGNSLSLNIRFPQAVAVTVEAVKNSDARAFSQQGIAYQLRVTDPTTRALLWRVEIRYTSEGQLSDIVFHPQTQSPTPQTFALSGRPPYSLTASAHTTLFHFADRDEPVERDRTPLPAPPVAGPPREMLLVRTELDALSSKLSHEKVPTLLEIEALKRYLPALRERLALSLRQSSGTAAARGLATAIGYAAVELGELRARSAGISSPTLVNILRTESESFLALALEILPAVPLPDGSLVIRDQSELKNVFENTPSSATTQFAEWAATSERRRDHQIIDISGRAIADWANTVQHRARRGVTISPAEEKLSSILFEHRILAPDSDGRGFFHAIAPQARFSTIAAAPNFIAAHWFNRQVVSDARFLSRFRRDLQNLPADKRNELDILRSENYGYEVNPATVLVEYFVSLLGQVPIDALAPGRPR